MKQFGKIVTKYETELRELVEFVPKIANFKEYLCSKFEEGLTLKIQEKMSVFGNQSYKEIVQLDLRAKKLTSEVLARESFKRESFGFMSAQPSKKNRSSESSSNSFGSRANSVNSAQTF